MRPELSPELIQTTRRVVAATAATLAGLGLTASNIQAKGIDSSMSPDPAGVVDANKLEKQTGPRAMASETRCEKEFGSGAICFWKVRSVASLRGEHRHKWIDCVGFKSSPFQQRIECSISKSKSNTVSAEIGGNAMVKPATLSAKVGYEVTKQTTVTTGNTVEVPKGKSGVVQWAGVFGNRKRVLQERRPCFQTSPGNFSRCFKAKPGRLKRRNAAYAYTEQFIRPDFRSVPNK